MRIASWRETDAFPRPPADAEHGWWEKGRPRAASREELERHVRAVRDSVPVLVWAPESGGRTVADSELAFLSGAIREREREAAERSAYWGAGGFFCWTLLFFFVAKEGGGGFRRSSFLWMWAMFGLLPLAVGGWRVLRQRRRAGSGDLFSCEEMEEARFAGWARQERAPVTIGCAVLVSLVFVGAAFAGHAETVALGGLNKAALWGGEWWRLWTGPWLHLHPLHAFFNLSALWYLGRNTEVLFGWRWLVLTLATALVAGSVASACWLDATSVGFSGAILGLLGLQIGAQARRPEVVPATIRREAWRSVIVLGVVGAVGWQIIDNAAHVGGLLAGAGLGWMLAGKIDGEGRVGRPSPWMTGIAALSLAASALGTVWLLFGRSR